MRYSDVSWKSFRERKTRDKIDKMNSDLPMEYEDIEERSCDDLEDEKNRSGTSVISILVSLNKLKEGDDVEILSLEETENIDL